MFFLTVSFISLELTRKFDFGVFFSIPAYLHFTEIYSVELLPADSQRGHLFNLYTMLKLELISNSIYINGGVGIDSIFRLFSHSWRKKLFLRYCLSIFYFQKSWKSIIPNHEYWGVASIRQAKAIPKLGIWKSQFEKLLLSPNKEILWIASGNCSGKYVSHDYTR